MDLRWNCRRNSRNRDRRAARTIPPDIDVASVIRVHGPVVAHDRGRHGKRRFGDHVGGHRNRQIGQQRPAFERFKGEPLARAAMPWPGRRAWARASAEQSRCHSMNANHDCLTFRTCTPCAQLREAERGAHGAEGRVRGPFVSGFSDRGRARPGRRTGRDGGRTPGSVDANLPGCQELAALRGSGPPRARRSFLASKQARKGSSLDGAVASLPGGTVTASMKKAPSARRRAPWGHHGLAHRPIASR